MKANARPSSAILVNGTLRRPAKRYLSATYSAAAAAADCGADAGRSR